MISFYAVRSICLLLSSLVAASEHETCGSAGNCREEDAVSFIQAYQHSVSRDVPDNTGLEKEIRKLDAVKAESQKDEQLHMALATQRKEHLDKLLDKQPGRIPTDSNHGTTCSDLRNNQDAYFTVEVGVGTPAQKFNLVADTGSDALIVPDCRCVEQLLCSLSVSCFKPEHSDSFALDEQLDEHGKSKVVGAKMNYGSGEIDALVGSDHIHLAGMTAKLLNGVFLMEDRSELRGSVNFEGIFGLGLPHSKLTTKLTIPTFMEEASSVKSYSLCYNAFPEPGALRTSPDALKNPLTNIGEVHWGLGIQGFSVGDASTQVVLCDPAKMPNGQATPCGAIPDSGTTMMMGPSDQIHTLYSSLCLGWSRCNKTLSDSDTEKDRSKAFHNLISDCESWMTKDQGVSEAPSIFIHVSGAEGAKAKQVVELAAWAYIVETTQDTFNMVSSKLFGNGTNFTGTKGAPSKTKKVCTASFGPQDYDTPNNGPVWILGSPMFYSHRVGFSAGGPDTKPQISFQDEDCSTCDGLKGSQQSSLLSVEGITHRAPGYRKRQPRRLSGPIRHPGIDVTKPL